MKGITSLTVIETPSGVLHWIVSNNIGATLDGIFKSYIVNE